MFITLTTNCLLIACIWLNNIFKHLENQSRNHGQFRAQLMSSVMQYQTSLSLVWLGLILICYYTVVCTIWKYIVRVCIVLKTRIGRDAAGVESNTGFQYNIFPYCTYHCIITYLLYSWNDQYYNNNFMLYCNLPTAVYGVHLVHVLRKSYFSTKWHFGDKLCWIYPSPPFPITPETFKKPLIFKSND